MSRTGRRFLAAAWILTVSLAPLLAAEKPSLVIVISVDQMRPDYLDRFRPYFRKDGFARFLEAGAVFPQARQRYASTFTGPGHAAIGGGLDPTHSGIVANYWYDADRHREVYCVEDRRTQWVGTVPGAPRISVAPASPVLEDDASLGDRLKENFPASRVVGIALKDRAAVLMAGRKADVALWFEEAFSRFVTSSYYPPHADLLAFNERLPGFFTVHPEWTLSGRVPDQELDRITFDPPSLYDAKNPPEGFGATFPHRLRNPRAVISSPFGDILMLDLSRFVIETMRLGSSSSSRSEERRVGKVCGDER